MRWWPHAWPTPGSASYSARIAIVGRRPADGAVVGPGHVRPARSDVASPCVPDHGGHAVRAQQVRDRGDRADLAERLLGVAVDRVRELEGVALAAPRLPAERARRRSSAPVERRGQRDERRAAPLGERVQLVEERGVTGCSSGRRRLGGQARVAPRPEPPSTWTTLVKPFSRSAAATGPEPRTEPQTTTIGVSRETTGAGWWRRRGRTSRRPRTGPDAAPGIAPVRDRPASLRTSMRNAPSATRAAACTASTEGASAVASSMVRSWRGAPGGMRSGSWCSPRRSRPGDRHGWRRGRRERCEAARRKSTGRWPTSHISERVGPSCSCRSERLRSASAARQDQVVAVDERAVVARAELDPEVGGRSTSSRGTSSGP